MDGLVTAKAMSIALKLKESTCSNILREINKEVRAKYKIQTTEGWVRATRVEKVRDTTVEELLRIQAELDEQKALASTSANT